MNRVSTNEAIHYGFSMFKYFFGIGLLCLILVFMGNWLISIDFGPIQMFGAIFVFSGFLLAISASYGAIYKLIADSVKRGSDNQVEEVPISSENLETAKGENKVNDKPQNFILRELIDWSPIIAVIILILIVGSQYW